jgi:hypothetical protein
MAHQARRNRKRIGLTRVGQDAPRKQALSRHMRSRQAPESKRAPKLKGKNPRRRQQVTARALDPPTDSTEAGVTSVLCRSYSWTHKRELARGFPPTAAFSRRRLFWMPSSLAALFAISRGSCVPAASISITLRATIAINAVFKSKASARKKPPMGRPKFVRFYLVVQVKQPIGATTQH